MNEAGEDAGHAQTAQEAQPSTLKGDTAANASNYDAAKARKSKKRTDSEVWQEKLLRCLEPVDVQQEPGQERLHRVCPLHCCFTNEGKFVT